VAAPEKAEHAKLLLGIERRQARERRIETEQVEIDRWRRPHSLVEPASISRSLAIRCAGVILTATSRSSFASSRPIYFANPAECRRFCAGRAACGR